MSDEQNYVVFDGSNKPIAWPAELHGSPTRIFKQSRSGGWEAFLKALDVPRQVRGVMIAAPPQSLSIMVSGLKAHFPQTFLDLMKLTLVLLTDDDDSKQVDPLKRLYGFRTLVLSAWTEDHLMDFVGNIFQPPLEQLPDAMNLDREMAATQMADYYSMLGLQREATHKEINAALHYYREYWAERARNPETRAKAEYSLALISQAEGLLSEPAKRERYDAVLETVRNQPRGKGARGTRRLEVSPSGEAVYQPTGWTRDGGITSRTKVEEHRTPTRREDKDPGVYRPPAWTREEREKDFERRAKQVPEERPKDDDTVYRPPSWSRWEEIDAAYHDRPTGDEVPGGAATLDLPDGRVGDEGILPPDVDSLPALEATQPGTEGFGPVRELRDIRPKGPPALDPADPASDSVAAAYDDYDDFSNLPGLGKRREDPGGEPWPPVDWPPKGWVQRESALMEDQGGVPPEEDHAPVATEEPPDLDAAEVVADEPAEADAATTAVAAEHVGTGVMQKVAPAGVEVEIWVSSVLALEPAAAFPADAGVLIGTRFEVGERQYYLVTGTYSLGGNPPGERIGHYVKTRPGNVPDAAAALEALVGPTTTVDVTLAVDLEFGHGRFFKVGASKRPYAASPVVRLTTWQTAPTVGGDRLIDLVRQNRWTLLALTGIVFLGLFTWSLYHSLGGVTGDGPPPLERLEVSSYIRADGVVLKWSGAYDKTAVYRVNAGDSTAHWKLIGHFADRRQTALDAEPVQRPGRWRYIVVATTSDPRRTLISDVQALDVR
ncbi:MAG: hypothetical protein FJZ01_08890 [Candidatus Sericytochromatia bacterium]|nr:hypothetical protein [Candidatus Tanganyikabacteria bacterium]